MVENFIQNHFIEIIFRKSGNFKKHRNAAVKNITYQNEMVDVQTSSFIIDELTAKMVYTFCVQLFVGNTS